MNIISSVLIPTVFLMVPNFAYSSDAMHCNEKIRKHLISSALIKCKTSYSNLTWSESYLEKNEKDKSIIAGFSFTCEEDKKYIGLIKVSKVKNCTINKTVISHASSVPMEPLQ